MSRLVAVLLVLTLICFPSIVLTNDAHLTLTDNDWNTLLASDKTEWMIKFFAPWCRSCNRMSIEWNKFEELALSENDLVHVKVASVDVTVNPILSRRFMISTLPTIIHVHDGRFRVYRGSRDHESFVSFVRDRSWNSIPGIRLKDVEEQDEHDPPIPQSHEHEGRSFKPDIPMNPMELLAAMHSHPTHNGGHSLPFSGAHAPISGPLPLLPDSSSSSINSPIALLSQLQSMSSPLSGGPASMSDGPLPLSEKPRDSDSDEDEDNEEEEEFKLSVGNDCLTARSSAESAKQKNPDAKTYIPECTDDGLYQEVQCYQSFCWCVDVHKGLPMKGSGTSGNDGNVTKPDCSKKRPLAKATKECPFDQKLIFLKKLRILFTRDMLVYRRKMASRERRRQSRRVPITSVDEESGVSQGRNSTTIKIRQPIVRWRLIDGASLFGTNGNPPTTDEILIWKFKRLDRNRDNVIDKDEWSRFKKSIKNAMNGKRNSTRRGRLIDESFSEVKHCFKLFFRGCDLNRDGNIVNDEWFECTGRSIDLDEGFVTSTTQTSVPLVSGGRGSIGGTLAQFRGPRKSSFERPSRTSSFVGNTSKKKQKGSNPFATILKAD